MSQSSCVVCYSFDGEKAIATPCCRRFVCRPCVRATPRYGEYCVLCQLPLTEAPYWSDGNGNTLGAAQPPGYDDAMAAAPQYERGRYTSAVGDDGKHGVYAEEKRAVGVQHYVRKEDTVTGLALAYGVDAKLIRKANSIYADHLLQAKAWVVIPGATVSLSTEPAADEEQKVRLKKFMVQTRCADYDMAKCESSWACMIRWVQNTD